MNFVKKLAAFLVVMAVFVPAVTAQSSLKGMSFNGSTGLYNVPSGRIGWEKSSNLGIDVGYHGIVNDGIANPVKISASLFKWVEVNGMVDFQCPENSDITWVNGLVGLKIQLPVKTTAFAIGGNFQFLDADKPGVTTAHDIAGQIYMAITYPGTFFSMPAETSMMFGVTFIEGANHANIDFGMGFDLTLLPKVFQNYVHWITDFSNFDYSASPWMNYAATRGTLNTGVRIDLSVLPPLNKFKFAVDIVAVDILDDSRSFAFGVVFGVPLL